MYAILNTRQRDSSRKEQEDMMEGEDGGRGENVDLTFTSAFLLSKVLAAAGTDKKKT